MDRNGPVKNWLLIGSIIRHYQDFGGYNSSSGKHSNFALDRTSGFKRGLKDTALFPSASSGSFASGAAALGLLPDFHPVPFAPRPFLRRPRTNCHRLRRRGQDHRVLAPLTWQTEYLRAPPINLVVFGVLVVAVGLPSAMSMTSWWCRSWSMGDALPDFETNDVGCEADGGPEKHPLCLNRISQYI